MENNMTVLSSKMFQMAVSENLTVKNAVENLKACTDFRTLSQKLKAFYVGEDIKAALIKGICDNHPEMNPETVSRNVRNWLNDRQNKLHKEDAIELCFILGLDFEKSNALVAMISEEALHWRHPDEIPYIYALCKGMSYREASELHQKIKERVATLPKDSAVQEEAFTDVIKKEIMKIKSDSALIEYVAENYAKLNGLHNTAYAAFCEMMDVLEAPAFSVEDDDYIPENEKYSVGRIVQAYMHRGDIPELSDKKNKALYSALQRNVAQNWPSETALSRIRTRHSDVTRKVLILLFLATYDADSQGLDDEDFLDWDPDYEKNKDEIFEEFYKGMNAMLEKCGFSTLDPRSPFDWMIIFCMCIEDVWELDSTLSEFLHTLFTSGNDLQN